MMACRRTFQIRADVLTSSLAKISKVKSLEVLQVLLYLSPNVLHIKKRTLLIITVHWS